LDQALGEDDMNSDGAKTWDPDIRLKLTERLPPVSPRDHQIAAWDRMTAHYVNDGKKAGLIVVPTGGGKTVLAAHWLLEHHVRNGGRVLWLAHRRSLLRQAFSTFQRLANLASPRATLGLIALSSEDSRWASVHAEHDVVFSSMQTAVLEGNNGFVHELQEGSPKGLFVVVDEAHHAPAPSYGQLLKKLKQWGCPLVGLTATPVRSDEADQKRLAAIFDQKVVYQVTRRELTERGILAAPTFETVKTRVNLEKDFTPEDYKYLERFGEVGPRVLERLARNAHRNGLIVDQYLQKRDTYGPTIVFAADTLHAATLAGEFQKKGVDADYVDYSRKNAQEIIERYQQDKKPDVLVNVEMLTEGFDAPHTRTVFIARPTRSEGLMAQMVGRALRGRQSGGNDRAYLVTFLDTWEQFNVLDAEYVLGEGVEEPLPPAGPGAERHVVVIPTELVQEAYRLLQSKVRGQFVGVYQCLPHGWYTWVDTFEDDQQRRAVMVFSNQLEGFEALLAAYPEPQSIPATIDEDLARDLVRKYFVDAPDPLPRWADVKALLDAKRKGAEVHSYTFEEKAEFDPRNIAKDIVDRNMTMQNEQAHLQAIWASKPACRSVYREDFQAFLEDVSREKIGLVSPTKPEVASEIEKIVPKNAPRAWPEEQPGYSLVTLRQGVLSVRRHFPNGPPTVGDLKWSKRASRTLWGFFRDEDKSITINAVLNSPDVPVFVLEFLMFHEMLHADMPSAWHNRDFRVRERAYSPSPEALEDAEKRGVRPGPNASADFWRVRADMFFDSFERHYAFKVPGSTMAL
jgi:superfamily II DNA or RNA helicase